MKCFRPVLMLSALLCGMNVAASETKTAPAATVRVRNLRGQWETPLRSDKARKGAVLLFVTPDCPISNAYAPEIERMVKAYTPKGFAFYLVYADPDVTAKAAAQHVRDYGYTCAALLDSRHALVNQTGATTTPEAILVAPGGTIKYKGRIDDRYVKFGTSRTTPTTRDLRAALDAVAQGKPVTHAATPVIGCYIPQLKP